MIFNLVLLSLAALVVAEPEPRRYAVAAPSAPTLAYVAAPLLVGSQRAAPATALPAALLAYTAPSSVQQQYVARTYNGITTLALEQPEAAPVDAPLVAAPAEPVANKYVVAPARVVYAEPEPARVRVFSPSSNLVFAVPSGAVATPVAAPVAAPEPLPAARVVALAPQAAPLSSSSQYFSRNYNGVPQVTYFVVGPAPAPVAVAPQAAPARRPAPRPVAGQTPAGEPVNQGDVEVLDA